MPVYSAMIQVSSYKLLREQASSFGSLAVRRILKGFSTILPRNSRMVIGFAFGDIKTSGVHK
ncbi:MAG: hypothetical protein LBQ71_07575 [Hungatella sp.]|nr:hypothetical protein [Hungatella sp.]